MPRVHRGGARWLRAGAAASLAIAVLHLGMIPAGAPAYEFFTAPDWLVEASQRGSWMPAVVTLGLALVFTGFAVCAAAGARIAGRARDRTPPRSGARPLLRILLVGICGIYTLRGALLIPETVLLLHTGFPLRGLIFSLASLLVGLLHIVGTAAAWRQLTPSAGDHPQPVI